MEAQPAKPLPAVPAPGLSFKNVGAPIPIAMLVDKNMRIRLDSQGYYNGRSATLSGTETHIDVTIKSKTKLLYILDVESEFDIKVTIEGCHLVLEISGDGGPRAGGLFGDVDPTEHDVPRGVTMFRVRQRHSNDPSCVNPTDPCAKVTAAPFDESW